MNSIQEFWKLLLEHFEKQIPNLPLITGLNQLNRFELNKIFSILKCLLKTFARYWQDNLIRTLWKLDMIT